MTLSALGDFAPANRGCRVDRLSPFGLGSTTTIHASGKLLSITGTEPTCATTLGKALELRVWTGLHHGPWISRGRIATYPRPSHRKMKIDRAFLSLHPWCGGGANEQRTHHRCSKPLTRLHSETGSGSCIPREVLGFSDQKASHADCGFFSRWAHGSAQRQCQHGGSHSLLRRTPTGHRLWSTVGASACP
ncbi:hypothetical protein BS50DRAFT_411971 [Corynespora cassiicola Philippines]|uniref:Uncharacterized protein n=1 Tax=Corynespora cassiicola Philippines TaxID=1448308 RepID=A0A2T2NLQ2_CORCC|nr:hypothetical protein BS50DRAFT_411971 [Corynespora cassiicola Philippines]